RVDARPVGDVAARVHHDPLPADEAFDQVDVAAVVEAPQHLDQVDRTCAVDGRDMDAARVGDHGARGDADDPMGHGDGDRHLGVHPAEELALRVGDVDLDVQGANRRVERPRGARHVAIEYAPGNLPDGDAGLLGVVHARGKGLRHLDEDADRINRLDPEEGEAARRAAGNDEAPDVDAPLGDAAVERRDDVPERHELGELSDVRLRGGDVRQARVHVRLTDLE